ncbi:MAG: spermine synthase, partial [Mariprofundaceae bacterium]|nr:spermine synthase [Mariprofundaceae bacterium]
MKRSHFATILLLLYGLSGVTALAYEVLWTRMLSLLFGISILGVVVTVAAFMLGLGLGSFMACRWRFSLRSSLWVLAAIEIGVAIYALLLPTLMHLLQGLWLSVDDVGAWQFWQISSALWVLCLPALALGFAFPTMLRLGKSFGVSLGALYGANTLGGALGALLPLLLLPLFGWIAALQGVAGLGVLIGLLLLSLAMYCKRSTSFLADDRSFHQVSSHRPIPFMGLLAYGGLGAGALMLEIAWTRAYGMILLRTEYVLAIILAVFLVGIGAGSMLAKHLPSARTLQWMPVLLAIMAIVGLYAFPYINVWGQSVHFDSLFAALLFQGLLIALCTLPITLLFGAWLPLIAPAEGVQSSSAGAWLYASNSVGACLGALLAGFVLIPWLGTAATWLVAAALVMLCGLYWSVGGRP